MLIGTLLAGTFAHTALVGQTPTVVPPPAPTAAPTPVPADPPPPLLPASDPAPISVAPAPAAKAEKKSTAKKPAPKPAAKAAPKTDTAAKATRPPVADLKPGAAVATEKNVNVRGQAAINSEIVTHLKRGDVVTVLEQVTLKKPGADEPGKWAKVSLPAGTAVWIHAGFTEGSKVKANRLNLRSGPGENFSILGRIDKGAEVHELERKGEWIKIQAPAAAYAYAAAHLLSQEPVQLAAALARNSSGTTATAAAPSSAPVKEKPVETVAINTTPAVVVAPTAITTPASEPAVTTPPPRTDIVATTPPTPPPVAPEPPPSAPASAPVPVPAGEIEPLVKRIVTREGIVRGSASIQAPTYFVLRSIDNNKTINYLHSVDTNIVLRAFQHQRVIVVGEEILDERWPNTPVIDVESIQAVP